MAPPHYPRVAQLVEQSPVKGKVTGSSPVLRAKHLRKVIITKANILLYDLEVSRDIVAGYGNKWEFKVVKTIRHQELMCYSYKWLGEKKIHFVSRHDFKTYKAFVQSLADVLDKADIAIAHNGVGFDNRMSNRFFIKERVMPPSMYRSIDTLKVARTVFKFQSNSLRDLAEYLGLSEKATVTYAELEDDFMSKKPSEKTVRMMKRYNNQDVKVLEEIYLLFRPFIKNHPNLGVILQKRDVCAKCGGSHLQARGREARVAGMVQRWYCNDCGANTYSRLPEVRLPIDERPNIVN